MNGKNNHLFSNNLKTLIWFELFFQQNFDKRKNKITTSFVRVTGRYDSLGADNYKIQF